MLVTEQDAIKNRSVQVVVDEVLRLLLLKVVAAVTELRFGPFAAIPRLLLLIVMAAISKRTASAVRPIY